MRTLLLLLFFVTTLFGKETIEVFASKVSSTKNFFKAEGDVLLLYDGALLKADKATYDKNTSTLILSGGVEMIRKGNTKVASESIHINTETKFY